MIQPRAPQTQTDDMEAEEIDNDEEAGAMGAPPLRRVIVQSPLNRWPNVERMMAWHNIMPPMVITDAMQQNFDRVAQQLTDVNIPARPPLVTNITFATRINVKRKEEPEPNNYKKRIKE